SAEKRAMAAVRAVAAVLGVHHLGPRQPRGYARRAVSWRARIVPRAVEFVDTLAERGQGRRVAAGRPAGGEAAEEDVGQRRVEAGALVELVGDAVSRCGEDALGQIPDDPDVALDGVAGSRGDERGRLAQRLAVEEPGRRAEATRPQRVQAHERA